MKINRNRIKKFWNQAITRNVAGGLLFALALSGIASAHIVSHRRSTNTLSGDDFMQDPHHNILGARKLTQLEDNLKALEFTIPSELRKRLDEVSAPPSTHPYVFFEPFLQTMIHGSSSVKPWQPARAQRETVSSKEIPGAAVEA